MKEIINKLKNIIFIKEEYPNIKNNKDIISETNKELISVIKKFNLNNINKDFEYYDYKKNNISIKKIFTFELIDSNEINIIRDRKLFKLNDSLTPGYFIYTYTERSKDLNNSYIKVYDQNLKLLFTKFIYPLRICDIVQLSNKSILLILSKLIMILKIDINNKSIDIIQEFEKKQNFILKYY